MSFAAKTLGLLPNKLKNELIAARYPEFRRIQQSAEQTKFMLNWGQEFPLPAEDSALWLDDARASELIGVPGVVSETALFALAAAVTNLSFVGELIRVGWYPNRAEVITMFSLCRSAVDGSLRAVRILCPSDRDMRIQRAFDTLADSIHFESEFVRRIAEDQRAPQSAKRNLLAELDKLDEFKSTLRNERHAKRQNFPSIVDDVQEWINEQRYIKIGHSNDNLKSEMMDVFSIGSAALHGHQWITKLARDREGLFYTLRRILEPTVNVTLTAIALMEARARSQSNPSKPWVGIPEEYEFFVQLWLHE